VQRKRSLFILDEEGIGALVREALDHLHRHLPSLCNNVQRKPPIGVLDEQGFGTRVGEVQHQLRRHFPRSRSRRVHRKGSICVLDEQGLGARFGEVPDRLHVRSVLDGIVQRKPSLLGIHAQQRGGVRPRKDVSEDVDRLALLEGFDQPPEPHFVVLPS
jgi:hypothetical protein